jgi:hypothetical protein
MFNKDHKREQYKVPKQKSEKPKQSYLVHRHKDNHPQNPTQNRLPKYGSQSETTTNT